MTSQPLSPQVIAVWAQPRSRSTALFRWVLARGDAVALHEPFCNVVDYGATDIGDQEVRSVAGVMDAVLRLGATHGRCLFKDTTDQRHPEVLQNTRFLREVKHTFMIRDPYAVAKSFFALKPDMSAADIGLDHLLELYHVVRDHGDPAPVVIDADDLITDPDATLRSWCQAVGWPYDPAWLTWEPGTRQEWGRSSRWHEQVSTSRGFASSPSTYVIPADDDARLRRWAAQCMPAYEELRAVRLRGSAH